MIPGNDRYEPRLSPFDAISVVDGGYVFLKEHVELTAKQLYGEDFQFQHSEQWARGYMIRDYSGLGGYYQYGIWGQERGPMTVILDYEEYDDRFEVTATFPSCSGDFIDEYDEPIARNQLIDCCQNKLQKHKITLKKDTDGSFIYYAHQLGDV